MQIKYCNNTIKIIENFMKTFLVLFEEFSSGNLQILFLFNKVHFEIKQKTKVYSINF
jgi:hypothetical protein